MACSVNRQTKVGFFNSSKIQISFPPLPYTKLIRHVSFELEMDEQGRQSHGLVVLGAQGNVPIAGLESVQRQNALAQLLAILVVNRKAEHRQLGKDDLSEDEGLRGRGGGE